MKKNLVGLLALGSISSLANIIELKAGDSIIDKHNVEATYR